MLKHEELIARKARLEQDYQRSKRKLEQQTEVVRKKEQEIQRLEGEIAVAVLTAHDLTATELSDLLSDLNSPRSKENFSFLEEGGEA